MQITQKYLQRILVTYSLLLPCTVQSVKFSYLKCHSFRGAYQSDEDELFEMESMDFEMEETTRHRYSIAPFNIDIIYKNALWKQSLFMTYRGRATHILVVHPFSANM